MTTILKRLAIAVVAVQLATGDLALASDDQMPCFDVSVIASIVDEVPSTYPECGSDCIIMSWPWFVDLKVRHVLQGELKDKELSVLAALHTPF